MATKLFKRTNDKDVFDTIIDHDNPPAAEDTQAITDSDDSETSKTADSAPDDDNTATAPADTDADNHRGAPPGAHAGSSPDTHAAKRSQSTSRDDTGHRDTRRIALTLVRGGCATPSPQSPF